MEGQHLSTQVWPRGGRAGERSGPPGAGPALAGSVQGTGWSEGGQLSQMTPEARTTGGLVHLTRTARAQVRRRRGCSEPSLKGNLDEDFYAETRCNCKFYLSHYMY